MLNIFLKYLLISAIFLIGGSFLIYALEHGNPDSKMDNMLDAIWWTVATVTTVGYGDVVPTSDIGRVVGIAYMFVGIIILGMFIAQVRTSILGTNWLGKDTKRDDTFAKQLKNIEEKQDRLFEMISTLQKKDDSLSEKAQFLLEEYRRLLKKAENSTGLDEEKLPQ